jgi:hypothetical protein
MRWLSSCTRSPELEGRAEIKTWLFGIAVNIRVTCTARTGAATRTFRCPAR